jgi:hypothetical protein
MSRTYDLCCFDCGSEVDIGAIVQVGQGDPSEPQWRFYLPIEPKTFEPLPRERFLSVLEHFLLHHRGHALGVVPWAWIEQNDPEGTVFEEEEDFQAFLSRNPLFPAELQPEPVSDNLAKLFSGLQSKLQGKEPG